MTFTTDKRINNLLAKKNVRKIRLNFVLMTVHDNKIALAQYTFNHTTHYNMFNNMHHVNDIILV